jgi:hypothetical protein
VSAGHSIEQLRHALAKIEEVAVILRMRYRRSAFG